MKLMFASIIVMVVTAAIDPNKLAEPTRPPTAFTVPYVTSQPDRDKEIRWYSTVDAPSAITANGQMLRDEAFTFASRDLPFGTRIRVYYKGKHAIFRCNDRGPNHVELTLGGFTYFEDPAVGVLRGATITILGD